MVNYNGMKNNNWILAIHKDRIFWKNFLENKEMVFINGVKNIQVGAYNGERTVTCATHILIMGSIMEQCISIMSWGFLNDWYKVKIMPHWIMGKNPG